MIPDVTLGPVGNDLTVYIQIAKSQSLVLKRKVLDKEDKSSRIKKQTREKKQGEPSYNIISGDMIPGYTGYIAKSEKVKYCKKSNFEPKLTKKSYFWT